MPEHDLLEARILVDEEPLEEYDAPQDEKVSDGEIVRYIRATTGKQFKILARFKAGYEPKDAECLYCKILLDGVIRHFACNPLVMKQGVLVRNQQHKFHSKRMKDSAGRWKRMYFSFGNLTTTADAEDLPIPATLNLLGTIRVTFYRAKARKRAEPRLAKGIMPLPSEAIPEDVLKGQGIKSKVSYVASDGMAEAPEIRTHDYVPVPGDAGKKVTFVFKYRTKGTLQSLGCIPRTPSPEPEPPSELERTKELLRISEEARRTAEAESQDLRRQLEQIQRLVNGGTQSRSTVPQKRERDVKEEEDATEGRRSTPRRAAVTIEIDD